MKLAVTFITVCVKIDIVSFFVLAPLFFPSFDEVTSVEEGLQSVFIHAVLTVACSVSRRQLFLSQQDVHDLFDGQSVGGRIFQAAYPALKLVLVNNQFLDRPLGLSSLKKNNATNITGGQKPQKAMKDNLRERGPRRCYFV